MIMIINECSGHCGQLVEELTQTCAKNQDTLAIILNQDAEQPRIDGAQIRALMNHKSANGLGTSTSDSLLQSDVDIAELLRRFSSCSAQTLSLLNRCEETRPSLSESVDQVGQCSETYAAQLNEGLVYVQELNHLLFSSIPQFRQSIHSLQSQAQSQSAHPVPKPLRMTPLRPHYRNQTTPASTRRISTVGTSSYMSSLSLVPPTPISNSFSDSLFVPSATSFTPSKTSACLFEETTNPNKKLDFSPIEEDATTN